MRFEHKITLGFLLALLVQTGGALVWAGAAGQRIATLEQTVSERRTVVERLVRVESGLEAMSGQLDRIERKLEDERD